MANKYKPNKGMKKRFRVSATGKVKRHHAYTSHLRSARSSKRKRHLRGPAVLAEGLAKNIRGWMGMPGLRPKQIAHERRLKEAAAAAEGAAATEAK
jgi:large subunit ribosomal protein L35